MHDRICRSAAGRLRLKCDGTRAETRFRLSAKRTSPFKSAGASVQSTTGSRGVRISFYFLVVMLDTPGSEVVWRVLATHSIRQFPLHFLSRASPCAVTFQTQSTQYVCSIRDSHPPSSGTSALTCSTFFAVLAVASWTERSSSPTLVSVWNRTIGTTSFV